MIDDDLDAETKALRFPAQICFLNNEDDSFNQSHCTLCYEKFTEFKLTISQPSDDVNLNQVVFKDSNLTYLSKNLNRNKNQNQNDKNQEPDSNSNSPTKITNHVNIPCSSNAPQKILINSTIEPYSGTSLVIKFSNLETYNSFQTFINQSKFISRTEEFSAQQYFQFYALLSQQQNMMQDYVRTGTYQKAMLQNSHLFKDKVVMDCGAGSAILSFFAIQAGAKKVYAVEASNISKYAIKLVESSPYKNRIIVVPGKIEEVVIPEKVDILISEPMGYMLYNERMIESYVHAKKFLKRDPAHVLGVNLEKNDDDDDKTTQSNPENQNQNENQNETIENIPGLMFPSLGDLYLAPFSNEPLYLECHTKASFWHVNSFYGIDLSGLHSDATNEYFSQPIVDQISVDNLLSLALRHRIDFRLATEKDFETIEIPFRFNVNQTNLIHGLAFWFDVGFLGGTHGGKDIWLSTCPNEPLTHWYQVWCVFKNPLFGRQHEHLSGVVIMKANQRQSYDIKIEAKIDETDARTCQEYDLKNPFFRYNGAASPNNSQVTHQVSPSNQLWNGVEIGPHSNILGQVSGLNFQNLSTGKKGEVCSPENSRDHNGMVSPGRAGEDYGERMAVYNQGEKVE